MLGEICLVKRSNGLFHGVLLNKGSVKYLVLIFPYHSVARSAYTFSVQSDQQRLVHYELPKIKRGSLIIVSESRLVKREIAFAPLSALHYIKTCLATEYENHALPNPVKEALDQIPKLKVQTYKRYGKATNNRRRRSIRSIISNIYGSERILVSKPLPGSFNTHKG